MLEPMPDELTPRDVAEQVAYLRDAMHGPAPGEDLGERDRGRLEGAADTAELVLRLLARIPGVPTYTTAESGDGQPLAPVYSLHRQDEQD